MYTGIFFSAILYLILLGDCFCRHLQQNFEILRCLHYSSAIFQLKHTVVWIINQSIEHWRRSYSYCANKSQKDGLPFPPPPSHRTVFFISRTWNFPSTSSSSTPAKKKTNTLLKYTQMRAKFAEPIPSAQAPPVVRRRHRPRSTVRRHTETRSLKYSVSPFQSKVFTVEMIKKTHARARCRKNCTHETDRRRTHVWDRTRASGGV